MTDKQPDTLRAAEAAPQQEVQEPYGWLYDWTHSSATGKPDTSYTSFTKDEAHAQKHDNCIAIYTAQPAPQQEVQEPAAWLEYARKKPALRRLVFTKTPDKELRVAGWVAEPLSLPQPAPSGDAEDDIESAAKALAECMDYPWEHMPDKGRAEMRKHADRKSVV